MTAKPGGKATGLGLAISDEIIAEKDGGKLWCESQEEGGTKFAIALPVQLASVSSLKNQSGDRHLKSKICQHTQNLQQSLSHLN